MSGTGWKRAVVVGLGTSGRAAARLLVALDVHVTAYDQRAGDPIAPEVERLSGPTVPVQAFDGCDLLVLSPGVPPGPVLALAERHAPRAEIHGELGLALTLIDRRVRPHWPAARLVLITGTNGKSTVTALTGALLKAAGRRVFIGGNLGQPLCDQLSDSLAGKGTWPDDIVLECSSYQLETLPPLLTEVAMLLNVTPDHLDRYPNMEAYAQTKGRVFAGLRPDGLALLSDKDDWTDALAPATGSVIRVGSAEGPRVDTTTLHLANGESLPRTAISLPGTHNANNAVFAVVAARHLGVSLPQCTEALAAFAGLPHRMTLVRELDGVAYYNDSKATNVASALASLGGLDRRFVLIAGGKAKGDDLGPLGALLASRAQGLVAIGEARESFAALTHGHLPTATAADMATAVTAARAMAHAGDAVVLAPACASFDQYDSYAHRGTAFTDAVRALT